MVDQEIFDPIELQKRQSIIDACLEMNSLGINQGTSGNISVRHEDYMLITPSGIPYKRLTPHHIVRVYMDGSSQGLFKPSSEWRFHRDILFNRPDLNSVVHTHSIYASMISIMDMDIPAVHYMIAVAGGDNIRCAPYATFGSEQLSQNALKAMEGRKACLLSHHGVIAAEKNLDKALWLAGEVETLARQYYGVLQIGKVSVLSKEEMEIILEQFKDYGHKDPTD